MRCHEDDNEFGVKRDLFSHTYIKNVNFESVKVQVICVLLQNYIFVIKIIRSCFSLFGHDYQ